MRSDKDIWIRVYDPRDKSRATFKDYDIWHPDMAITITDDDAFIWPEKEIIDVGPRTLGIKVEE